LVASVATFSIHDLPPAFCHMSFVYPLTKYEYAPHSLHTQ